jgi:flagellar protein FliS
MRYNPNPWQSYRQVATKTATPGQLVLMLFDGALRFLDKALVGFDLDDPLDSNLAINNNILKAQEIIRELNVSLNLELGGEFAFTMRRLYNYYDLQLAQSNLKKDPEGVRLVIRLLLIIRGAWAEMLAGGGADHSADQQTRQAAELQLQAA